MTFARHLHPLQGRGLKSVHVGVIKIYVLPDLTRVRWNARRIPEFKGIGME